MTAAAPSPALAEDDAGQRGSLTVHERVVVRIAERVAGDVTGWTDRPSGWSRLGGQRPPRAEATIVGRHVRLTVSVAARGGRSLPDLASDVRERVRARVTDLTGLVVDAADVHVVRLTAASDDASSVLSPAPRPAAPGASRHAAVLIATVLIATGIAAGYEALASAGVLDTQTVVQPVLERLDGVEPETWMAPVGAGVAILGVLLVVSGLLPRPRRSLALRSPTGVYASRRTIERMAVDTASAHPGVVGAQAIARRAAVVTRIRTDGEEATAGEVTLALQERLAALDGPPQIRVPAKHSGGDS